MAPRSVGTLLFCVIEIANANCFEDAIPVVSRSNITVDGLSMPIGTWELQWDSASIVTRIFEILSSEKLGFHVANLGGHSSSTPVVYKLGGCLTWTPEDIGRDCVHPRRFHFAFESWQGASTFIPPLLAELGDRAPVNLGTLGYAGSSGMYVLGGAVEAALADSGLSLRYYANYNADWFQPSKYTATVADVNMSRLGTCDDGVSKTYRFFAPEYLEATGDTEGIYVDESGIKFKCWKEKWWLPPACRDLPANCSTLITHWPGWGMGLLTQWVSFHNMPIAIGIAVERIGNAQDEYVVLGRELRSLVYWWKPDVAFLLEGASPVVLPPYDPAEHSRKIYRTGREKLVLTTWAAAGMDEAAYRAHALADALSLSNQEIDQLLLTHMELATTTWDTACRWLKDHPDIWEGWIPSDTACVKGQGLVDAVGKFVTARDAAVACEVCPVGTSSQESESTRICVLCPAGSHQSLPGEAFCEACEAGTIAPEDGMMECQSCGLGTYANFTGMKSCFQCGADMTLEADKLALFTTSQKVSDGPEVWIPVQGAASQELCGCISGAYLAPTGLCQRCPEGSECVGSKLSLLEGYYSKQSDPGDVFKCKDKAHCPGGEAGTCATGRDPHSVACSACLTGLHDVGGECGPCRGGDYIFLILMFVLLLVAMTAAYFTYTKQCENAVKSQSFIIISCSLGQLAISLQVVSVINNFHLEWGEPIKSIIAATEVLAFELNIMSFDCITPSEAVMLFLFHAMILPFLLLLLCVIHFLIVLVKREKTLKLHRLGHVTGAFFAIFFISLCSSLMPPFLCYTHPNNITTVRAFLSVYCTGTGQHAMMLLVSGLAYLLPVLFLTTALWLLVQLPRKLQAGDMLFIQASSFLYQRFRPGAENFSLWLLLRNALLVLLPLGSTSASTFMMNILLSASLMVSAFVKPWRMMACNYLDMFLISLMIFVVTLGSHVAGEVNPNLTIVGCLMIFILMFLAIAGFVVYGAFKWWSKDTKTYRFFLSHHKSRAGCVARWLKMELLLRGHSFNAFVDSDDLNDLTKLFWYVGHETSCCVFLATSEFSKRKWCMGEATTARTHQVESVLIAWPDFVKPSEAFIENYGHVVPDIVLLAKHGIDLSDLQETLRWISNLQTLPLSSPLTAEGFSFVVNKLTATLPMIKRRSQENPPCCIVADPDNTEAVAAAFVLSELMDAEFIRQASLSQTMVMTKGDSVPSNATLAVVVCTAGCFKSIEMAKWTAQLCGAPSCCALPVLADDHFELPGPALYQQLASSPEFQDFVDTLVLTIKAVFEEIGIVCPLHTSSQDELELRASRVTWRLLDSPPRPIAVKVESNDVGSVYEPQSMTAPGDSHDYTTEFACEVTSRTF